MFFSSSVTNGFSTEKEKERKYNWIKGKAEGSRKRKAWLKEQGENTQDKHYGF